MLECEEYEDKEGLSRVQSNLQLNLEIFSDFRTAASCGPNSETLTTSHEESLNTKVVDLFELYHLESEFAKFREGESYGRNTKGCRIWKADFGKDKDFSFNSKQGSFMDDQEPSRHMYIHRNRSIRTLRTDLLDSMYRGLFGV